MGIPITHPSVQQALDRGLVSREALGLPPLSPPARRPIATATPSPSGWLIELTVGCRVVSEANARDHWAVAHRRAKQQAAALAQALDAAGLSNHKPPLPVQVMFVRIGRQMLDDDNLARAFKALRDRLAEWLGCDDGDEDAATWGYRQEVGKPGVTVRIEGRR